MASILSRPQCVKWLAWGMACGCMGVLNLIVLHFFLISSNEIYTIKYLVGSLWGKPLKLAGPMHVYIGKLAWAAFNSSDAGDGILQFSVSILCLLIHWLLKSPVYWQAWYWLCKMDNMYCYSRVNFIYLDQAKLEIRFKMWIYFLWSLKQFSMLIMLGATISDEMSWSVLHYVV